MYQKTYKDEVAEKLAKSLTAQTPELIPYLPELLVDIWDLGSSPEDMRALIEAYLPSPHKLQMIDMGCAKGAAPVYLARTLGCHVKGIDIIPEFIDAAEKHAQANDVEALCEFAVGDINEAVLTERNYDVAILDAIMDVLGTPAETIRMIRHVIKESGYLLINDAYKINEENNAAGVETLKMSEVAGSKCGSAKKSIDEIPEFPPEVLEAPYLTYEEWLALFRAEGLEVVATIVTEGKALFAFNEAQKELIRGRAEELMQKHPEKKALFEAFIKAQEGNQVAPDVPLQGITWLVRKIQFVPSRYR
ncbi:class I SAM-dependent methyltransferase [Acidaminobacter hydrogenoformans]|uniref:Methyltransferase domain-containing protein n=1 Tax=Acidaminobacter hydrogenoformans DSM 2784 TaxID=1120920 RepID=A0A1G5S4F9_9FIRM|nr:methyltransferase domain-containing protein [Acidaminobacter hydrogenoformans]SCZ81206.1 Methyltransferase domain-containing protein [Acidaminobacter hydrogenoformans DSM 2784]